MQNECLRWFRNFRTYSDEYFPGERLGVADVLLLKNIVEGIYSELKSRKGITKFLGRDLLRLTGYEMSKFGYNVRKTQ